MFRACIVLCGCVINPLEVHVGVSLILALNLVMCAYVWRHNPFLTGRHWLLPRLVYIVSSVLVLLLWLLLLVAGRYKAELSNGVALGPDGPGDSDNSPGVVVLGVLWAAVACIALGVWYRQEHVTYSGNTFWYDPKLIPDAEGPKRAVARLEQSESRLRDLMTFLRGLGGQSSRTVRQGHGWVGV